MMVVIMIMIIERGVLWGKSITKVMLEIRFLIHQSMRSC